MSHVGPANDELDDLDASRSGLSRRDRLFLAVLVAVVASFVADWRGAYQVDELVLGTQLTGLDWLFLCAADIVAFYLVVPLAVERERALGYWREIRTNRWATASLAVLVGFVVVGLVGPLVLRPDGPLYGPTGRAGVPVSQPPVGFSIPDGWVNTCASGFSGDQCHGSWQYPFGTTTAGRDVLGLTVVGARVAVEIATITVAIVVPIATLVGTTAATYGGRIDELLMRYVDVQQSIPAFFVIILAVEAIGHINRGMGRSLVLVVLVFGLLSWGGIARIVRSEALEIRAQDYVQAARSAGASRFDVVRTHVVPNALPAVLTAVTVQIGWLLLLEATLVYLGLGTATHPSWGYVMVTNMSGAYPTLNWWAVIYPAFALGLVVVAFQLLGDALRDVTDPRTG